MGGVCSLSASAERRGPWSLRSFTSFRMTNLERDDRKRGGGYGCDGWGFDGGGG